jgi:hypothetical protein
MHDGLGYNQVMVFVSPNVHRNLNVRSCLTGMTHDFTGALLTRFFLGFVEAAFFPGALFLLSKWYISPHSRLTVFV